MSIEDEAALGRLRRHARGAVAGMTGAVRLEEVDGVFEVLLDHPTARNAVTTSMMCQLVDVVNELDRTAARAVLLRSSTGGAFCAGGHLGEVKSSLMEGSAGADMSLVMMTALARWRALPCVTIALLEGPAVGGGAELAVSADLRWATSAAWLEFRQARLGVAAGWGGAAWLVQDHGARIARRLLAGGERLSASGARAIGIVDEVREDALEGCREWLKGVARAPDQAVETVLAQVAAEVNGEGLPRQVELFGRVWGAAAHRRALGVGGRR